MGKRHAPVSLAVPIPPPKRARVAQNEAPDIVSKACRDLPLESIKMIAEYAAEHRPRFAAFKQKYGNIPATDTGMVFYSGWHPKIQHDNIYRFEWSIKAANLNYLYGKQVLVRKHFSGWQNPEPVTVVDATRRADQVIVDLRRRDGSTFHVNTNNFDFKAFVDVKRCEYGGCRRDCEKCNPTQVASDRAAQERRRVTGEPTTWD